MQRTPTAFEQALLEYINQARLNPGGEFDVVYADGQAGTQANITNAVRFFGVEAEAYRAQMAEYDAVAPLAWNAALATAAQNQSQLMIETDTQSHRLPGQSSLGTRITEAGYINWRSVGENIYAYADDPLFAHAGFMIDWGYDDADLDNGMLRSDWKTIGDGIQDGAGHRVAIMSTRYTEIGIGVLADTDPDTRVGPYVVTQNFGTKQVAGPAQLLGVVIDDADGDRFYDIGEGQGGMMVTATGAAGTFTTQTWASGGYQIALAAGTYSVAFSGGAHAGSVTYQITVGTQNVKLDAMVADLVVPEPVVQDPVQPDAFVVDPGAEPAPLAVQIHSGGTVADMFFGDGFVADYFPDVSAQVFRLYQAVLGRDPDLGGHAAWTVRIALEDMDPLDVVQGFMGSPEFLARFGGLGNTDFVELLYDNVLGRTADAGGLARWTGELDAGADRAQVVLGFADSPELTQRTAQAQAAFDAQGSAQLWGDDVFRLYQATLDRDPDLSGFLNWSARLANGMSFGDVADGFVGSPEFVATYSTLGNDAFVTLLYANVLDRAPDAPGLDSWTTQLEEGMGRAQVVEGFSQSREFGLVTADDFATWVRAQGTDDILSGGGGNDVLAGGALADTFVLSNLAGHATVLDLEVWDRIDLRAFGYGSDVQARLYFSQQGDDVVFNNGADAMATFIDVQLALLSDDMLLI